jgi:hypothetical protein
MEKKGKEGHKWQVVAISQEGMDNHDLHQRVELRTATCGKWRNTLHDLQEDLI